MKNIGTQLLFCIVLIFTGCENNYTKSNGDILTFPLGRSLLGAGSIDIKIGDKKYYPNLVYDSCGGFWMRISKKEMSDNKEMIITITRKKGDLKLFLEKRHGQAWVKRSYYIDSDNESLASKAKELTSGLSSIIEKAKVIQQFVIKNVKLMHYKDTFLDKASTTYRLGYGTCINSSRLYVALCRAVKIPARTIWGVVYDHENDNIYDYHHQWAEIRDESGYWHPSDFTYTTDFDLNDIRYLDLIYAAEENTYIKSRDSCNIIFDNLKYFNDYPITLNARLGFELKSDNRPDSMVVEYSYSL